MSSIVLETTTTRKLLGNNTLELKTVYSGEDKPEELEIGALLQKSLNYINLKDESGRLLLKRPENVELLLEDDFSNWNSGKPNGWGIINPFSDIVPNLISLTNIGSGVRVSCDGNYVDNTLFGFSLKDHPFILDMINNLKSYDVRIEISGKLLKGANIRKLFIRRALVNNLEEYNSILAMLSSPYSEIETLGPSEDIPFSIEHITTISATISGANTYPVIPVFVVNGNSISEFELYSIKIYKIS